MSGGRYHETSQKSLSSWRNAVERVSCSREDDLSCVGAEAWTRARLNELIKGERDITGDSALDLARVQGTSAKLWMDLQATFNLDKAMRRRKLPGPEVLAGSLKRSLDMHPTNTNRFGGLLVAL